MAQCAEQGIDSLMPVEGLAAELTPFFQAIGVVHDCDLTDRAVRWMHEVGAKSLDDIISCDLEDECIKDLGLETVPGELARSFFSTREDNMVEMGTASVPRTAPLTSRSKGLDAFWEAIGGSTPELQTMATEFLEKHGAQNVDDIAACHRVDLGGQLTEFLGLKLVQKINAERFWRNCTEQAGHIYRPKGLETQLEQQRAHDEDSRGRQRSPRPSTCLQRSKTRSPSRKRVSFDDGSDGLKSSARSYSAHQYVDFFLVLERKWVRAVVDSLEPGNVIIVRYGNSVVKLDPRAQKLLLKPLADDATRSEASNITADAAEQSREGAYMLGETIYVYSCSQHAWVLARVTGAFCNGSIVVTYLGNNLGKTIMAEDQVSLVRRIEEFDDPIPIGTTTTVQSQGQLVSSEPSSCGERPSELVAVPGVELDASTCSGSSCQTSENLQSLDCYADQNDGLVLLPGEAVSVYSQAMQKWVDARVSCALSDGHITVTYMDYPMQKMLTLAYQPGMIRRSTLARELGGA